MWVTPKGTQSPKMQIEAQNMSSGHPTRAGGSRESICIPISQQGAAVPRHQQHGGPQSSPGYSPEPQLSPRAATGCSHAQQSKTRARRNK